MIWLYIITNNLSKKLSYIAIGLLIINLYNIIFGSPMLLDSIDNIDPVSSNNSILNENNASNDNILNNNNNDYNNDNQIYYVDNKNFLSKTKRWFYWRIFVNRSDEYKSYDEFKKVWASGFSLRKTVKEELKKFKSNPIKYIKETK